MYDTPFDKTLRKTAMVVPQTDRRNARNQYLMARNLYRQPKNSRTASMDQVAMSSSIVTTTD